MHHNASERKQKYTIVDKEQESDKLHISGKKYVIIASENGEWHEATCLDSIDSPGLG